MSKSKYLLSIDSIPMNIAIYKPTDDGDFIFVDFNKRAEITENISREALIGKKITDVFAIVKEMGFFNVLMRVHQTSQEELVDMPFYQDEYLLGWRKNRVCKLDNGYIMAIYEDRNSYVEEFTNDPSTFKINRDTMQKNENSVDILKSKERMDLAFKASISGYWEWNMLDDTAYYSSQWKEMLGFNDEDGLPDLLSTWATRVHPEDIEPVMLKTQKTLVAKLKHIEVVHRLKHKNGNWIWIIGRAMIEYDSDGKACRMVGIHTDITKQKNMQLKFAHQAKIIEQFHDSVISTDMNGIIVSWNSGSQKLFGYSADKIIGKNISLLFRKKDLNLPKKYKEILIQTGSFNGDAYRVTKSKEVISVSVSLSLLKNEQGVAVGIVGYTHDIKKRKKAEKEIKNLNKTLQNEVSKQLDILRTKDEQLIQQSKQAQMGEMISMIAHQWRQPLSAISATSINSSILSTMEMLEDEQIQEDSEFIQEQCQLMSQTIDTFMNFVKPEKESKVFKLLHTVDAILNIMGTQLANHNIKISVNTKDENISIKGHEDLLEQVIINILSNARDAFEELDIENKFIDITIEQKDNMASITIEDNAGGIKEEIREKIFNPYFTTKEQGKGTGIGLYMSIGIMKKSFNGNLIYSATKGGSRFELVCKR